MPTAYKGVPSNLAFGSRLGVTLPADGDPDAGASFATALQALSDQTDFLHEVLVAQAATSWFRQPTLNTGEAFAVINNGLSGAATVFLALGGGDASNAHIYRSTDGMNWGSPVLTTPLSTARFYAGVWCPGINLWVVGGYGTASGNGSVYTSPDGITWTARTSGANSAIESAAWGNNFVVLQLGSGAYVYSANGTSSWFLVTGGPIISPGQLIYANSLFVGVGFGVSNVPVLVTSPDGLTFTSRAVTAFSGGSVPIMGVAYGNGLFVAVDAAGVIASSPDGITWTQRSNQGWTAGTGVGGGVVWTGRAFVVVGASNSNLVTSAPVAYSLDGITWTTKYASGVVPFGAGYGWWSGKPCVHPSTGAIFTGGVGYLVNSLPSPLP